MKRLHALSCTPHSASATPNPPVNGTTHCTLHSAPLCDCRILANQLRGNYVPLPEDAKQSYDSHIVHDRFQYTSAVTEALLPTPGEPPSNITVQSEEGVTIGGPAGDVGGRDEYEEQVEGRSTITRDQMRAAVLGACDGIVTTGALVTGIAAAQASQHQLLLSAVASMASGSISMAVGELVSMTQKKEMERLAGAEEDADEASAWIVALTSWACFIGGSIFPTLAIMLPGGWRYIGVCAVVVGTLLVFGAAAGFLAQTSPQASAVRLALGGIIAIVFTSAVGRFFGVDPSSSILLQMWSPESNICSVSEAPDGP